jgi:hypothetical protein
LTLVLLPCALLAQEADSGAAPLPAVAAEAEASSATAGATDSAPAAPDIVPAKSGPSGDALRGVKQYDAKFVEIEEQIGKLKEDVFGSKTRLMLLREQVLHNVVAESRLVLVHENEIGMGYDLVRVIYYLDNNKVYFADNDNGQLGSKSRFLIYDGAIVPGNHVLKVEMNYAGSGGLFTYVEGYAFDVKSSFTFFASKGKILQVNATGYSKGGAFAEYDKKPGIKYRLKQVRYTKENLESLLKDAQ